MLLITDDKGEKAIQCDFIEEARTFETCRYITVEGDWYAILETIEREEEGDYLVWLQKIDRPEGVVAPDRVLFVTGDAELSAQV